MPIDKRKMTNITNQHTWLSSISFSTNTIYLLLIFISLAWNGYNTYQYQILTERQLKLENILREVLPSSSSLSSLDKIQATTVSSVEQWFTKAFHFIQQLTSKDITSNSNSSTIVQPYTVSFVFLEMLNKSLDTCVCICTYGSCQGHTRLFQTCITN
jgi:hypothetical protein